MRAHLDPSGCPLEVQDFHRERDAILYVRQSSDAQLRQHQGSGLAQGDLREIPRRWGWSDAQIRVIDQDTGSSAKEGSERDGILEVLELIQKGRVGIVFVFDLSRLSRDAALSAQFFSACRKTGTLLHYNGTTRDPANETPSELFGLHIHGLVAWLDNETRALQAMAAKVAMAKRGRAASRPPVGYIRDERGGWVKDPDPEVQAAILRLFQLYKEMQSLGAVVKHLKAQNVLFPRRANGEIQWKGIDAAHVHSILTNRTYQGAYIYRFQPKPGIDPECSRPGMPRRALIKEGHHEPYIDPADFDALQASLAARRPPMRRISGKGAAVLSGLLRCPTCGRVMEPKYWGRNGQARTAKYVCREIDSWGDVVHRVVVPARFVDHVVVRRFLRELKPVTLRAATEALAADQSLRASWEVDRLRQLKQAERDVEAAFKALAIVDDGEHPYALAEAKRRVEEATQHREELKITPPPPETPPLAASEIRELLKRASGVEALWEDRSTTHADRRELLHTLISEIKVTAVSKEAVDLDIVWIGDEHEALRALRPAGADAFVRSRTAAGEDPQTITDQLNAADVVTAAGRAMTPNVICQKLGRMGLRLKDERQKARQIIRQALMVDKTPRPELLRRLQTEAPRLGPWDPQRLSDAIRQLRRGVRNSEPLPASLPAEEDKQRAISIIDTEVAAGKTWTQIASMLNDAGLRPPRGIVFTPIQTRLLFMRARGLKSFRLPRPTPDQP